MTEYECEVQRRKQDTQLQQVKVITSNKLSGNRVWVKLPEYPKQILGFKTYDGMGIVYQHPNSMFYAPWIFMRIHKTYPVGHKYLNKKWRYASRIQKCIGKAIEIEKKVCLDLKEVGFPEDSIFLLPYSGVHSGGTDIVLAFEDHYHFNRPDYPKTMVHGGSVAIEVLGVTHYHGRGAKFTYPPHKDFKGWVDDCYEYGTIPILAWIDEGKVWYMIMNPDYKELEVVFYTRFNYKKYGYRQRKNYAPIGLTTPFKMDRHGMYACLNDEFITK